MFCKNCGLENPDGASFCRVCGSALAVAPVIEASAEPVVETPVEPTVETPVQPASAPAAEGETPAPKKRATRKKAEPKTEEAPAVEEKPAE